MPAQCSARAGEIFIGRERNTDIPRQIWGELAWRDFHDQLRRGLPPADPASSVVGPEVRDRVLREGRVRLRRHDGHGLYHRALGSKGDPQRVKIA